MTEAKKARIGLESKRIKALEEWCEKLKVASLQPQANFLDGFDAAVEILSDENAKLVETIKKALHELDCGMVGNAKAYLKEQWE